METSLREFAVLAAGEYDQALLTPLAKFEVAHAADGHQALAVINKRRPDLAVIDTDLPGVNGFEVARLLRKRFAKNSPPLVALAVAEHVNKALDSGLFNVVLAKPLALAELDQALLDLGHLIEPGIPGTLG